jgi:8-oxo-dGTP diphosphatase
MSDGSTDARPSIEVAAGLVFRDGKVLITRRHPEDHLGGLWEFPGGKREPGETFEECLKRELAEELGIEVEVEELLESLKHAYPEETVCLKFFRCRWKRNEPQALGCGEFEWVGAVELKNYEFPAADARLLQLLQSSPQLWR